MAFDTLQVKAMEGLISFTNTIPSSGGHRSSGASSTWRGREREIGKGEMNNLKRHQQPHLTKATFYSSSNLQIHDKLFKRNDFKVGAKLPGTKWTWGETTCFSSPVVSELVME